ncbi:hypothetical protein [Phosphitispora sp. TUW77]|uniref:hypothetical protein n=1 Tax=Phosphitispora sp. TUW77 TaxID=3152361 RepID=UPI003AB21D07
MKIINKEKISLAVCELDMGFAKGVLRVLAFTVADNGDIRIQKDTYIDSSVQVEGEKIIAIDKQDLSVHEMGIIQGKFSDKVVPRSNLSLDNSIKAFFLLGSNGIIPASDQAFTAKVG